VLLVTHSVTEAVLLADRVAVLSPRPGRVIDEIAVELPRPREAALLDTADFRALVRRIEAVLATGGTGDATEFAAE